MTSNSKFQITTPHPLVTNFHNPTFSVYLHSSHNPDHLLSTFNLWLLRSLTIPSKWLDESVMSPKAEVSERQNSMIFSSFQSYFCWLFFSLCTWRCGSIRYGKRNKLRVLRLLLYWLLPESLTQRIPVSRLFFSLLFLLFYFFWSGLVWPGLAWSSLAWSSLVCSALFCALFYPQFFKQIYVHGRA